jgi:hypothetical protein
MTTRSVRTRADAGAELTHRRHKWPTFLVTAAHEVAVRTGAVVEWQPHGMWHLRRPTDLQTACGLPAVGWRIFWTLLPDSDEAPLCARCVDAAGAARQAGR